MVHLLVGLPYNLKQTQDEKESGHFLLMMSDEFRSEKKENILNILQKLCLRKIFFSTPHVVEITEFS